MSDLCHCFFPVMNMVDDLNHVDSNKEEDEESEEKQEQVKEKKHDMGAADLEKVTDYAEEKEVLSSSTDLEDAIATISKLKLMG